MRRIALAVLAATAAIATAPVAAADPYDPSTPYQIGQNPALPGNRPLQPHCLDAMLRCGYHFDIDNVL
jgi:hypothetical protein